MTPIVLTGAVPGLLRRGSPAMYHANGQRVIVLHVGPVTVDVYDGSLDRRLQPPLAAVALDLSDPTGRFHALLWLQERGHEVPTTWPIEAVAWSVLSVSRGGPMLAGIDDVPKFVNTRSALTRFCGANLWWTATETDRDFFLGPTRPDGSRHHGWYWANHAGQEVGDDAIQTVCNLALSANYALRNADGALTLPELPNGH